MRVDCPCQCPKVEIDWYPAVQCNLPTHKHCCISHSKTQMFSGLYEKLLRSIEESTKRHTYIPSWRYSYFYAYI